MIFRSAGSFPWIRKFPAWIKTGRTRKGPAGFFYFFASITQNPPERSSFSTEA